MIEFLNNVSGLIEIVIDFFVNFFKNIIELLSLVFKGAVFIFQVVQYMPIQYKAVVIAFLAYCVIRTVANNGIN